MAEAVTNNEIRANVYKLLSLCYQQPDEDLGDIVVSLAEQLCKVYLELAEPAGKLVQQLPEDAAAVQQLQVDHAKLFIGPFDLLAPPYGSVYLEEKRKVMGDTTMEVIAAYQEAGLQLDENFKEPPDHIVAELEFMYFLIFKELQGEATVSRQKRFLERYLQPWAEPFCRKIIENAATDFYKITAEITRNFIRQDLELLSR
ncbi:MAG: molecular chaperone TorD family protein [Thermoanaerobacteraceae bacterium]|nr:molecular chaperone TorD family protein [Thermoanaerobacteraceae bacterium]